jgi:hypothetical protein
LAYWFGYPDWSLAAHSKTEFLRADEGVTDAGGSFVIPAQPSHWGKPALVIFKPGFGEYRFQGRDAWRQETFGRREEADKAWDRFSSTGVVFELPRLATSKERLRHLDRVSWHPGVPFRAMPLMDAFVKQERTYLGLSN